MHETAFLDRRGIYEMLEDLGVPSPLAFSVLMRAGERA
jgi:hypothetical protein